LSDGSRSVKNIPQAVEVLVARRLGRDLGPWEGFLVQSAALLIVIGIFYWFVASGLLVTITTALSDWYVHQLHFGPAPTPARAP
jgi:hypothetical protein